MSRAASINGVVLTRKLTKIQVPKVQRAIAKWIDGDGDVVESQEVIMCPAVQWPRILRGNKALANWSVLLFGDKVVAISPATKVV